MRRGSGRRRRRREVDSRAHVPRPASIPQPLPLSLSPSHSRQCSVLSAQCSVPARCCGSCSPGRTPAAHDAQRTTSRCRAPCAVSCEWNTPTHPSRACRARTNALSRCASRGTRNAAWQALLCRIRTGTTTTIRTRTMTGCSAPSYRLHTYFVRWSSCSERLPPPAKPRCERSLSLVFAF